LVKGEERGIFIPFSLFFSYLVVEDPLFIWGEESEGEGEY
jgi:hypothetical protein